MQQSAAPQYVKCRLCKKTKKIVHFARDRTRKTGYASSCRACRKQYDRQRKIAVREFLLDYLKTHHCVDCGESDPVVLEFDHVTGVKRLNLADARSVPEAEREVKECVVRCANCHRRKTALEFNWFIAALGQ